MPLRYFSCEAGNIPIEQCLERCPRPEGRCLALGHLIFISESGRVWQNQASVTQLIKPTRLAFLEITKDYAVNPDDMAFMMYGTLYHRRLEIINKRLEGLAEYKISSSVSGVIDRLEPDELQEGFFKIIDYKLVGGFSIARALGIKQKNGDTAEPDMFEWELQLNKYCLLVERDTVLSKLFPISRLLIQACVRDSGLKQINMLQIPKRMPLIPVNRLPVDFVDEYFLTKEFALRKALENNDMGEMCDFQGRWGGRRCHKQYCQVYRFCPEGAKINRVPLLDN